MKIIMNFNNSFGIQLKYINLIISIIYQKTLRCKLSSSKRPNDNYKISMLFLY